MWTLSFKKKFLIEILFIALLTVPVMCGFAIAQNAAPAAGNSQPTQNTETQEPQVQAIHDASVILNAPQDAPYFQHVQITAPEGVSVAPAAEGSFLEPMAVPQYYALQVGTTYRFRVTNIPLMPGVELFPTIEIIDRTHPPIGEELRHAVVIQLAKEDLYDAIRGKFVTRVIYIENPDTAFPISSKDQEGQGWFDVSAEANPVKVAETLGRPIVIVRMGGRAPGSNEEFDMAFLNNCPPFLHYPPAKK